MGGGFLMGFKVAQASPATPAAGIYTYRHLWAPTTAYALRDVILDESSTHPRLMWTPRAHTSPASFATGSEYDTSSSIWLPLNTTRVFRGRWQAGVWYTAGDLFVEPVSNTIVSSRRSQASGATYDPTIANAVPLESVVSGVAADTLLAANGIPDLGAQDVAGIWQVRSRIRHPRPTWIKFTPNAASVLSTSGTGSLTDVTADVPVPGGAVQINFPQTPVWALGTSVDLTQNTIRLLSKMTGSVAPPSNGSPGTWPNTVLNDVYLSVSSDSAFTNYHKLRLVHSGDTTNIIPTGAWWWQGAGPAEWTDTGVTPARQIGTGATLSAITHVRLECTAPGTGLASLTVAGFQLVRNNLRLDGTTPTAKAKVVLRFDDDNDIWTVGGTNNISAVQEMLNRGMVGVLCATLGQTATSASASLSGDQLRFLMMNGWDYNVHASTLNEHNQVTDSTTNVIGGRAFRAQVMKSKHLAAVHGLRGGDDFGNFGNNAEMNADFVRALRQNFRAAHRFIGSPRQVETLPPVDPHIMWGWGAATGDAADATDKLAYVDRAAAMGGLCVFTYHHPENAVEFIPFLNGLATRVSGGTVDVVTVAEALAPWTVAA
jgi:hypothetical protein